MKHGVYLVLCLVCLLSIAGAVPVWGATPQSADAEFRSIELSGEGVLGIENGSTFTEKDTGTPDADRVFFNESDPFAVSASIASLPATRRVRMCVYERANGTETKLRCSEPVSSGSSPENVELSGINWSNESGTTRQLAVVLRSAANDSNEDLLAKRTLPAITLTDEDDEDGDGLANAEELGRRLDPLTADMDEDGLTDGAEVGDYGSNPRNVDSDSDGVRDGEEIEVGTDPTDADTDGDGLDDEREITIGTNPTNPRTVQHLLVGALLGVVGVLCVAGGGLTLRRRVRSGDWKLHSTGTEANADARPPPMADSAVEVPAQTPELLTDADRVRHLLDRHGGRTKQSTIVEETEWSKAKVSRLLSAMADDGEIQKISIGRENLIALDGHEFDVEPDRDGREQSIERDA